MRARWRNVAWTRRFLAGLLTACLLVAGCATSDPRGSRSAGACCASLSAAPFLSLEAGKELEIRFDDHSPTYAFSTGSSRFEAVKLPSERGDGVMEIAVLSSTRLWLGTGSMFVPSFLFLDTEFQPVGQVEPTLFSNAGKWEGSFGEEAIFVHRTYAAVFVPAKASYVAVFTDVRLLGSRSGGYKYAWLGDGAAHAHFASQVRGIYSRIDKREFAAGNVKSVQEMFPQASYWNTEAFARAPDGRILIRLL